MTTGLRTDRIDRNVPTPVGDRSVARQRVNSTDAGRDHRIRRRARRTDGRSLSGTIRAAQPALPLRAGQCATTGQASLGDHPAVRFAGQPLNGAAARTNRAQTIGAQMGAMSAAPIQVLAAATGMVAVGARQDDVEGQRRFTVAIDGPAAAGKSTVGEIVAHRLSGVYFDTGLLYRAVTYAGLDRAVPLTDGIALAAMAHACDIQVRRPTVADGRQSDVLVDGIDVTTRLRGPDIDRNVSVVSAHAEVRDVLLETQRRIGRLGRVVMVGRDIGTVVMPDADVKIFLDASPEERARRRHQQLADPDALLSYEQILEDMLRRDAIDSKRGVAPLRPAHDAIVIDSDVLTIEQVAERIIAVATARLQGMKRE